MIIERPHRHNTTCPQSLELGRCCIVVWGKNAPPTANFLSQPCACHLILPRQSLQVASSSQGLLFNLLSLLLTTLSCGFPIVDFMSFNESVSLFCLERKRNFGFKYLFLCQWCNASWMEADSTTRLLYFFLHCKMQSCAVFFQSFMQKVLLNEGYLKVVVGHQ